MSQRKKNGRKFCIIGKNSLTPIYCGDMSSPQNKKETPLYTSLPGYYIVEAAVTIPVFVCFMMCIMFFFCMLQLQLQIQTSLSYTGRMLSEYAVLERMYLEKIDTDTERLAAEVIFRQHLKEQNIHTEYIQLGMMGIQLSESEFDGEYIHLKAVYRIRLPIGMFGRHVFVVKQQVKTRKWLGDMGEDEAGSDADQWVYITPSGIAYHKSSECPYLALSIRSVAYVQIERMRNKSGGKYDKCRACKNEAGAVVYITDYGDVYHTGITCSGLKRSIQRVRKEDTGSRHACLKCGG